MKKYRVIARRYHNFGSGEIITCDLKSRTREDGAYYLKCTNGKETFFIRENDLVEDKELNRERNSDGSWRK